MFDSDEELPPAGAAQLAGLIEQNHAELKAAECRMLQLACAWVSWEACADVDDALSDLVGMMPWPRFATIVSATIAEADPTLAAERAERARSSHDVFSFDSDDGLKTIVAKAAAGDAIWFMAAVNRIADILAARGDTDPVGIRRPVRSAYWPGRLRLCSC
jgi:hypothetical protein